ncbi:MAG: acylphosphatase [Planctomycetales bacterium]|nr:acylphosphatase [Planctomycetales bacterium]
MRVRLLVSGVVQGVGFRYATEREAARWGVAGHVRNLPDGRVEVVAEGDEAAVAGLASWCRRGPRGALVEAVEETREEPMGEVGPFRVAR